MHALIIEDDNRLAQSIQALLKKHHFASTIAETGEKGIYSLETESYDVIILDWMLPGLEGIEVCKSIRKKDNSIPIIMLTAKSQIEDKVEGLINGADDYLTKPFASEELIARINALIRRKTGSSFTSVVQILDLVVNTSTHVVVRNNTDILLAPREYALLEYLVINKNKAVDRIDLLHHVWGEDIDPFSNTVDVHIRYLRKKIDDPFHKKLIRTVKGKGYMICGD